MFIVTQLQDSVYKDSVQTATPESALDAVQPVFVELDTSTVSAHYLCTCGKRQSMYCYSVLLQCDFFHGRSLSVGVSMKNSVISSVSACQCKASMIYSFALWAYSVSEWCACIVHTVVHVRGYGPCFTCDAKCIGKQWDLESVKRSQHIKNPDYSAADTVAYCHYWRPHTALYRHWWWANPKWNVSCMLVAEVPVTSSCKSDNYYNGITVLWYTNNYTLLVSVHDAIRSSKHTELKQQISQKMIIHCRNVTVMQSNIMFCDIFMFCRFHWEFHATKSGLHCLSIMSRSWVICCFQLY